MNAHGGIGSQRPINEEKLSKEWIPTGIKGTGEEIWKKNIWKLKKKELRFVVES
jgi:hypothetical protein